MFAYSLLGKRRLPDMSLPRDVIACPVVVRHDDEPKSSHVHDVENVMTVCVCVYVAALSWRSGASYVDTDQFV